MKTNKKTKVSRELAENLAFGAAGVLIMASSGWLGGGFPDAPASAHWLGGLALFGWGLAGRALASRSLRGMRKQYEEQAALDEGTGTLSRTRLIEAIEREMKAAKRKGTPLSMVMVEALNIMEINKKFDRLEGDSSLAAVALGTQTCLRDTDYLGRSGGLTFCALLPESNAEQSMVVMDRVAETLSDIVRSHAKGEVHIRARLVHRTWNGVEGISDFMAQCESDLSYAATFK